MTWTDSQWDAFCGLLEEGWPGEFDDAASQAYRTLLDDAEPGAAAAALKRLLYRGNRFRPSAGELLGEIGTDPTRPTFDEAYRLIFGGDGVLRARPKRQAGPQIYASERQRQQAFNDAATERAATMHPLIGSFVVRQGLDRLRALPLEDPDWGEKTRRDLQRAWEQHVEACEGRDVAALASGRRGRGELAQLDPLAALGVHTNKPQLESADKKSNDNDLTSPRLF